jgi:hypothetical protein
MMTLDLVMVSTLDVVTHGDEYFFRFPQLLTIGKAHVFSEKFYIAPVLF